MSKAIPAQHPAVVLRSQYRNVRSLLAVAIVAIVGLSVTVVTLAVDEDGPAGTSAVSQPAARLGDPLQTRTQPTRPLGGPSESAVAAAIASQPPDSTGPDESKIAAAIGGQQ